MKELMVFDNQEFGRVRMVEFDGKPYAVGNDVAGALEYVRPYEAITAHCKGAVTYRVTDAIGREQETKVIPEGDIYRLIVKAADQSKNPIIKEKAERFERWIFDDVLPSIRKGELQWNIPTTLPEALRLAADLAEKNEVLQLQNAQQNQVIHELQPKATYYDIILQNKSLLAITKIAKDYGMSGTAMNAKLHELGVQYKQGDVWLLYQKHADKGYTHSKTHIVDDLTNRFHTYWTQKGRLFIYALLKQNSVLPLIERDDLGIRICK